MTAAVTASAPDAGAEAFHPLVADDDEGYPGRRGAEILCALRDRMSRFRKDLLRAM
jgi:hypothetical protein